MPKVMPNTDAIEQSRQNVAVEEVMPSAAVSRLKNAFGSLETVFVNRTEEINALLLAVISGCHILFEGSPGTAKSDLARECFARITGNGLVVYDKMFGKGTKEDDVFGPVDMTRYRERAEWSHNTTGALPSAHFANLEELGRASDMLLPSMMTVLNERIFHNGPVMQKCPLITAVASTNFLTETDELAAFNDRWLIRMQVKPLDNNQKTIEMITRSLNPRPPIKDTVSLVEILRLNKEARTIKIQPEVVPLFVELVRSYEKANTKPSFQISDRRLVHAFRLARANAVLEERDSVIADDLEVVKYGLSIVGKDDESAFTTVLQKVVSQAVAFRKENEEIDLMTRFMRKMTDEFDPNNTLASLRKMKSDCAKMITGMKARQDPFKLPANQVAYNDLLGKAEGFAKTIDESVAAAALR